MGTLIVPDDKPLAGQEEPTSHALSGDEACPLQHYFKWPSSTYIPFTYKHSPKPLSQTVWFARGSC